MCSARCEIRPKWFVSVSQLCPAVLEILNRAFWEIRLNKPKGIREHSPRYFSLHMLRMRVLVLECLLNGGWLISQTLWRFESLPFFKNTLQQSATYSKHNYMFWTCQRCASGASNMLHMLMCDKHLLDAKLLWCVCSKRFVSLILNLYT